MSGNKKSVGNAECIPVFSGITMGLSVIPGAAIDWLCDQRELLNLPGSVSSSVKWGFGPGDLSSLICLNLLWHCVQWKHVTWTTETSPLQVWSERRGKKKKLSPFLQNQSELQNMQIYLHKTCYFFVIKGKWNLWSNETKLRDFVLCWGTWTGWMVMVDVSASMTLVPVENTRGEFARGKQQGRKG